MALKAHQSGLLAAAPDGHLIANHQFCEHLAIGREITFGAVLQDGDLNGGGKADDRGRLERACGQTGLSVSTSE